MAVRKSDIEQENAKRSGQEAEDLFDEESDDDSVEDIDLESGSEKDVTARKRLEEYLEEKRLRKELDDELDFD